MSNQNRFLLPHTTQPTTVAANSSSSAASTSSRGGQPETTGVHHSPASDPSKEQENSQQQQPSVDTDFDSYWEEEARNPHRNRIRIGRQYQATVPPLLKAGEKDQRKLDELETLSFCPKKSARLSDTELDHYFTIAKSLNIFASLVETRSLLGRDVTIADLNHIRNKEGLSLASVIQPVRQPPPSTNYSNQASNVSPLSSQQQSSVSSIRQQSPQKSPTTNCDKSSSCSMSPRELSSIDSVLNQPLMKALSHFVSLHHPCRHDANCKKMNKDIPLADEPGPAVSITAGNLRQGTQLSSSSKEPKPGRSRSSLKQAAAAAAAQISERKEELDKESEDHQASGDSVQSPSYDDWTREEIEMFSKAIEVCGKNFSIIKKDFLPSKSVKSIVEYYYIGSRDVSESKKKSNQSSVDTADGCSSPEKASANNNSQGGGGSGGNGGGGASGGGVGGNGTGGSSASGKSSVSNSNIAASSSNPAANSSSRMTNSNATSDPNKTTLSSSLQTSAIQQQDQALSKAVLSSKQQPKSTIITEVQDLNGARAKATTMTTKSCIDARMSIYNFDEELKEDSPTIFDCPRPGAEVKPLKAKPIIPNSSMDSTDATNSNVGSLKFFMDGQLVLKLNACQEQQEGSEKCHWVQSGDKMIATGKQKRYTKKASDKSSSDHMNGSQSNSVISSNQDEDFRSLFGDDDSKESMNSFTNLPQRQQQKNNHNSPNPKRLKVKNEPNAPQPPTQLQQQQLSSPIDYKRIVQDDLDNRVKELLGDNLGPGPVMDPTMPWLQCTSLAMAAATLFGRGLPLSSPQGNIVDGAAQNNANAINNMASKPMDLSLEHTPPKPTQKSSSRSRNRSKNN